MEQNTTTFPLFCFQWRFEVNHHRAPATATRADEEALSQLISLGSLIIGDYEFRTCDIMRPSCGGVFNPYQLDGSDCFSYCRSLFFQFLSKFFNFLHLRNWFDISESTLNGPHMCSKELPWNLPYRAEDPSRRERNGTLMTRKRSRSHLWDHPYEGRWVRWGKLDSFGEAWCDQYELTLTDSMQTTLLYAQYCSA